MAHVTPVFKSGSRSSVDNYRGISILSCPAKLLELHVTNFLTAQLRDQVSKNQHAYLSGRSTTTNLVEYVSRLQQHMEKGDQVDAIYTDFSKAFDVIPHQLLLRKIYTFGVGDRIISWIASYLDGRRQRVKIDNDLSSPADVPSGVPQGSHIGPLLFALFINDLLLLLDQSDVGCSAYADDLKIFLPLKDDRADSRLQNAVDIVKSWCDSNGMILNPSKCQVISFTRKRQPVEATYYISGAVLQRVSVIKDLGVYLDNKLMLNHHVDRLIPRARSTLGMVKRFAGELRDHTVTMTLYKSLVRPILEYASPVWAPHCSTTIERIESIQKQFIIYALRHHYPYGTYPLPPYTQRLAEADLDSLANRRKITQALLALDAYNGTLDSEWIRSCFTRHVPIRSLRREEFFRPENHRTNYGRFEPINHAKLLFNEYSHLYQPGLTKAAFKIAMLTELRAVS